MHRRRFRMAMAWLVPAIALAAGCGGELTTEPAGKPTTEQILALRERHLRRQPPKSPARALPLGREATLAQSAADALARIGEDAVPALIEALQDGSREVRVQAARSLARMGARGAAAVGALIAALGDEDDEVRRQAARALGQMGPAAKEAVPHLVAALKEPARGGSEDRQGP